MDCRELEARLEAVLDGTLDTVDRRRCRRHLAACPSCRELVEPFAAAVTAPEELIGAILERTSGPVCGRAGLLLAAGVDGEPTTTERELLSAHLKGCAECRALAAVMSRLASELPRLAELAPEPRLVADVLAATLPLGVRLRRLWAEVWPRWVHRPRFASETAFVATLVLVLLVGAPGSPLAAVPARARELARVDPVASLERPAAVLEERFVSRVERPLRLRWARGEKTLAAWLEVAEGRLRSLAAELAALAGTSRDRLASLWERAEPEPPSEPAASDLDDQHPDDPPRQETP